MLLPIIWHAYRFARRQGYTRVEAARYVIDVLRLR